MRTARYSVVLLLLLIPAMVSAYPIPPQPLDKLTRESDLIVIARVVETTREESRDESDFRSAIARLQITSVLKGSLSGQVVEVVYPADLGCPAPPRYEKGKTVLAFLTSNEQTGRFRTVGLSYGTKYGSRRELEVYSARIREFVEIEQQPDSALRRQQLVEWFVRCAEEPATRREGMYETVEARWRKMQANEAKTQPAGPEVENDAEENQGPGFHTSDIEKDVSVNFTSLLTEEQKRRLTAALYGSPSINAEEMELIELVREWKDQNLTSFLWSYLKAFRADSPYITADLMEHLALALSNEEVLAVAEELRRTDRAETDDATSEGIRKSFLEKFIAIIEKAGPPPTMELSSAPVPEPEEAVTEPDGSDDTAFRLTLLLASLGCLLTVTRFLKV
jgi:hypothetical protein